MSKIAYIFKKFNIPTHFWTETTFDWGKYGKYKTLQVEPLPEIKTKKVEEKLNED